MKKEAIVDRIEGKKAVLLTEEEETVILPAKWFKDIHEGMAIDMEFTENPKGKRSPGRRRRTCWRKSGR